MTFTKAMRAALLAVPVALAGGFATAETLNMYTTQSGTTLPAVRGLQKFAEEVGEQTGGDVKVRLHLAGTLSINAADATSAVAANIVQMAEDLFFSGSVPIATALRLPLVVGDVANMDAALEASLDPVSEAYAAKGITVLAGYLSPPQYIWSTEEVGSLADLENLKLRVSSPEQAEFVKSLGAVPIVLAPAEVSAALERGVVDGLLTSGLGGEFFGGPLKSALLLPVNYNNNYFIINTAVYERLTPEQQETLTELAASNAQWIEEEFLKIDFEAIDRFRARDDFSVVDVSEPDMAMASGVAEPMWTNWVDKHGEAGRSMYDAIRSGIGD
ncbi:TRAP transporter substrate-binding protein DctP [Celeribacter indicus]|nr:TRAP transporter substrate-binding protein DctP [Celeribacter indicus]SDX06323.1 TRAP-type C4-dicarboxylate transport system, substrate-binding protein [Celeribacter indicus]